MADDLISTPDLEWRFISDQVMGGVSEGRAERKGGILRLSGQVSTANRGGFIQARTRLETPFSRDTLGLRFEARGNGGRYFVHLRTRATALPWQYYQAGFPTTGEWERVVLPFAAFKASGRLLRETLRADQITSVGVVAFGRDHEAALEVRQLKAYR